MGKNRFTDEEVEELKLNAYVKNVTDKSITYTEQFREEFYEAYIQGKTPCAILRTMGFDTNVLGQSRIDSMTRRIKKFSHREEGFKDTRADKSGRPQTKEMSQEEYVKYLEHKLKFQSQQIEALKKMKQADKKAQWKYLQSQKRNTK